MQTAAIMSADLHQPFTALIEKHRRLIFKVARTYTHNAADRDDLAQEITTQLWRAYPSYDQQRPVTTWMYRIALNVGISFLRNDGPRQRLSVPLDAELQLQLEDQPPAEADESLRILQEFISQLDPLNRALLLLYLDEHSYHDIAEILGISETNVSTKLNRLKDLLRRFGERIHGTR
jgi:RNA polymerase sigma-70 factor (ECF subfamily)